MTLSRRRLTINCRRGGPGDSTTRTTRGLSHCPECGGDDPWFRRIGEDLWWLCERCARRLEARWIKVAAGPPIPDLGNSVERPL
jgi:hypothetical protein